MTTETDADRLLGVSVTPDLFPALGVAPILGRSFTADEAAAPGLESAVILSHGLWQRRFGGDPAIVGRPVIVNERARTVVGVMPPRFKFPERSELFMPLRWDEAPRAARSLGVIGVLKPGTSVTQAQSDVTAIASRLAGTYPQSNRDFGVRVLSFRDSHVGRDDRRVSTTLMAAVSFVLLIACANLANLLLVRGAARQREMAVRAAMGASRARLIAVVLSESAVLAIAGTDRRHAGRRVVHRLDAGVLARRDPVLGAARSRRPRRGVHDSHQRHDDAGNRAAAGASRLASAGHRGSQGRQPLGVAGPHRPAHADRRWRSPRSPCAWRSWSAPT